MCDKSWPDLVSLERFQLMWGGDDSGLLTSGISADYQAKLNLWRQLIKTPEPAESCVTGCYLGWWPWFTALEIFTLKIMSWLVSGLARYARAILLLQQYPVFRGLMQFTARVVIRDQWEEGDWSGIPHYQRGTPPVTQLLIGREWSRDLDTGLWLVSLFI